MVEKELKHYGTKGMKWGVRNGPPYPIKRNKTVFVSGSSKTQTKDSGYYRKNLPADVRRNLDSYIANNKKIIVGDAPGIDRQVQNYLKKKGYDNVEIYGPGKKIRYSANKNWKTKLVDAPEFEEGSKEWLAKKDKAMTDAADEGFAVILDEGANATRNNVKRLIEQNKSVTVYELSKMGKEYDRFVYELLDELE